MKKQENANEQFDLGIRYYNCGNYKQAINCMLKSAQNGNIDAEYSLGVMYDEHKDYKKAVKWYKKSAEKGYVESEYNLANMYQLGQGVEQDYIKAFDLYSSSAEKGFPQAQCNLGSLYYYGKGIEKNYEEAFKWSYKASEQGNANAQYNLANMYYNGEFVTQNYIEAFEWYEKSAEQGYIDAIYELGIMYYIGEGTEKNYRKAIEKLKECSYSGHEKGKNALDFFSDDENDCLVDKIIKLKGFKRYVLEDILKIIDLLKETKINKDEITLIVSNYYKLQRYSEFIQYKYIHNNNISDEDKKSIIDIIENSEYNLNTTEYVFLGLELKYLTWNLSLSEEREKVDYNVLRVRFEVLYKAISKGLEEKRIGSIEYFVGYGDILLDFKINYDEDSNEKYNENNMKPIFPIWHASDKLYNNYTVYKSQYFKFEESSFKRLATAGETEEKYKKRQDGKELLSYNGVASDYLSVLEVELKKLVCENFDVSYEELRFIDAIEYLRKCNFEEFTSDIIDELHNLREIRNRVAHGKEIIYKEYEYIKQILIHQGIFKYISNNLKL